MTTEDFFKWGNLLIGIQFILGIQLIIVSIPLVIKRKVDQKTYLGLFCLVEGLWFFKRVFFGYWHENMLMYLLIGEGKPLFIGSLLLFYCRSFSDKIGKWYLLKHLWAPSLLYFSLMFLGFFPVVNLSGGGRFIMSISIMITGEIIVWTYFFLVRNELRTNVKEKLIPKAYKKVMMLFYSFYFFSLQISIWDIYSKLITENRFPESIREEATYLYNAFFHYAGEYLSYIFLHLFAYFLFLYALSELLFFKKLFLPKNSRVNQGSILNGPKIDLLMFQSFNEHKIYKDPLLTLEKFAKTIGVTKKEFVDYLKVKRIGLFKNYVNEHRVNEFKKLVKNENFKNYDLVGLAKECGFSSKTTFFRVFKDFEGITPNEYKNKKKP